MRVKLTYMSNTDHKAAQMNTCIYFILFTLAVSQVCMIFSAYIPVADYITVAAIAAFMILFYQKVNRTAVLYGVSILFVLLLGIISSIIVQVNNNNIFLCLALTINCIIYCNLVYLRNVELNKYTLEKLFDIVIAFGIISCVYNLAKNLGAMMSLSVTAYTYGAIFSSFYGGRNVFAAFLFLYVVMCMYQIAAKKKKIYYVVLLLFCINLVFTFSRASILALAIFIGVFVLEQCAHSGKRKLLLFFAMLLGGIAAIVLFSRYYDYIAHYLIRKNYGDSYRSLYWDLAGKNFLITPVFGLGPGVAEQVLAPLENIAGTSFHNTYIEIVLWGGLTLTIIYVVFLKNVFAALKKIQKKDPVFYKVYIAFILAFLVRSFFETTMLFAMGAMAHFTTILLYVIPMLYAKSIGKSNENE